MKNSFPITESKKVAALIGTMITSTANLDSNQDGKINTLEILNGLQTVAFKVIVSVPNLQALRQEATDYSEAEKLELRAVVEKETSMPSRKVEVLVERALAIVLDTIDFIIDARQPDEVFV